MAKRPRIINLDWLEVYCNEGGSTKDPSYFELCGIKTAVRDYGTPQYKQMFTILDNQERGIIEVRRDPYSLKNEGGIFKPGDCHLRLTNRSCYDVNPVQILRDFIIKHRYIYNSITRVDICLDFQKFDNGASPQAFINNYMEGRTAKLNQCRINAHGTDAFNLKKWNSIKWGSQKSAITTKMYNKSQELREVKPKFYISDNWIKAGLNPNQDTWRIEFSVSSVIKGFVKLDTGEIIPMKLTNIDTKEKLLLIFHSLAERYFDFRAVTISKEGNAIRKARCPKIQTFSMQNEEPIAPAKLTKCKDPTRTDKILLNRCYEIANDRAATPNDQYFAKKMCNVLKYYKRLDITEEKAKIIWNEILEPTMNPDFEGWH